MSKAMRVVRKEFVELMPAFLYFLVAFNLLGLTKVVLLRQYGIPATAFAAATIGALLVAKVILIAGLLPFMNPFRQEPIIYNVLWKTLIYSILAFILQLLEELIPALFRHGDLWRAFAELEWPRFWVVQLWLVFLLLIFVTFRELFRVLGTERAMGLFVGQRGIDHEATAERRERGRKAEIEG